MTATTALRELPPPGPYRARLAGAMTVSLLVHALLLSLQFGIPGIGLPSLELPWRERRAQAIDLHVTLAIPAAPPVPQAQAEPPAAPALPAPPSPGLKLVPLPKTAAPPARPATVKRGKAKPPAAARPPRPRPKRETPVIALNEPRENSFSMPAPALDEILPVPEPEADVPPQAGTMPEPVATPPPEDAAAREREQAALIQAEEEKAERAREAEAQAALQQAEEARRQEEEAARQRALALETQRAEEMRKREEQERKEQEERLALAAEERRQAALALQKQEEDARQREREEAARQALELKEKQRAEALRLQAEQAQRKAQQEAREAMELQARRQAEAAAEAARQQAAARERELQKQAEELAARRKAEAEAAAAAQAASAARREREHPVQELALGDSPAGNARIDALPRNLTGGGLAGRALEQARRPDVLRSDPPARQSDSSMDAPRRRSILGGKDVDVGLMMYVESWRLKIERNGSIMYPRAAVEKARGDPVVTVAVRSDGSVEEVVIHRSSGRPELDEAVHRIVRMNARYSAFPPELARRYDVIEIRRVWNFEDRLRILEEVR